MNNLEQVCHTFVIEDPAFRRTINLDGATYSIGRHSSNDIVLSCQKTSRHHATLLRRTDVQTNDYAYWILDGDLQGNRSRNGIYINGKKCLVHELKHGDRIKFSADAKAQYQIVAKLEEGQENIEIPSGGIAPVVSSKVDNKKTLFTAEQQSKLNPHLIPSAESHSFAELSPQPIVEIDLYGKITYMNPVALSVFHDLEQQNLNHPILKNLIANFHERTSKALNREVKVNNNFFEQTAIFIANNKIIRSYFIDITQQKALEKRVKITEQFKRHIFQEVREGIIIFDGVSKKILEVNHLCSELLGYSLETLLTMTIDELIFEPEKLAAILPRISEDRIVFKGSNLLKNHSGSLVDRELKITAIGSESENFCVLIDFNEINNNVSGELLATNNNNLNIFYEHLNSAISQAQRNQTLLAVILFNIDFFPNIKESIGQEQSDRLLTGLAQRLQYGLRSGDIIIRWQEDKFALLLSQINSIEEIAKIGQRIQDSLEQFFKIGDNRFSIKTNMGIAVYPHDGKDCNTLLNNANIALYRINNSHNIVASSQDRSNNYQFYNYSMNSQAATILHLEHQLAVALERQEFKLYYQPQININDGNIQGIEALLRWEHPELGLVSPASFIKLAEQTGLIIPIGEWIIKTACSQNKIWQSNGAPPLRVSVNVSPVQFQQPDFPATISKILRESELEANLLELELTATTLMENVEYSCRILKQLQDLGVHISIDDFATGFTSLEYLKQFPFNTLKIDRTFIQELKNDPKDLAIVSALVELGRGFNLRVVAEGVETKQQIELLRSLKCEQMQGFWFSRPLAAEETTKLLPFSYEEEEEEEDDDEEQEEQLDSEFDLNLNLD
ncbi:MAG: EAL domain-containing protein [Pleurocapsa sp.]